MAQRGPAHLPYRVLAVVTALFCLLFGTVFFAGFLDRALFQVFARPLFETNHWGYYLLGFAGSALIAWAGCLMVAVARPTTSGGIANATVAGLLAGAAIRLLAWYSGEYRPAGDQLRFEAGVLALLALGFIWLRPRPETPPS